MRSHRLFFFLSASLALLLVTVGMSGCRGGGDSVSTSSSGSAAGAATGNCIVCHTGIEIAHEKFVLGCAQCHGGNPEATTKEAAHVQPLAALPRDGTILPIDYFDLDYLRFVNPTNLRVVKTTCGQSGQGLGTACHSSYADDVMKSLMATTTGHLVGGAFQQGIVETREGEWGVMAVADLDGDVPIELGALASISQIPAEDTSWPSSSVQRHYGDVPRKLCTVCHLWSRGLGDRGVTGHEGKYRSEGCAACHFLYANDGLSHSADPTIDKTEVGHPVIHKITKRIDTNQCLHCHTRGARIGLSFMGLAQLPPNTPKGPGFAGISDEVLYGGYHIENSEVCPPDIHYERGMHCIDCHVREEIMGDGNIYGHMDQSTQIECIDCHGTPGAYGSMETDRGILHDNLRWDSFGTSTLMILTGKVDGVEHIVPQVKDIVDPGSMFYNSNAAAAMTSDHIKEEGGLECYACHAGWQNNCYGCHFYRDLDDTQLDFLDGAATVGHVETGDKYFMNWKNFQMGWNAEGKIAPYMTGCQVITNVKDENGDLILKQVLPVSGQGLSGLSLNPEQPHTIRDTPRSCQECHRNPAALGLGTESFNLARAHLYVLTSPAGSFSVVDRGADFGSGGSGNPKDPGRDNHAGVLGSVSLPMPRSLAVVTDPIHGVTDWAFVGDYMLGLLVIDCSDPTAPFIHATLPMNDPRDLVVAGDTLYAAHGANGVSIYDITDPSSPQLLSGFTTTEARAVAVHGIYLLVADGPAGLKILDIRDRFNPSLLSELDLQGGAGPCDTNDVFPFAHYFNPPESGTKDFKMVAWIADGENGICAVDLNDPVNPRVISAIQTTDAQTVFCKSHFDFGDQDTPSMEHEYMWVADGFGGLKVFSINEPENPELVTKKVSSLPVYDVAVCNAFEPPYNTLYAFAGIGQGGTAVIDFSDIRHPVSAGRIDVKVLRGIVVERVQLDRYVNEDGVQIKDTSHDGARPFNRTEMERILGVVF